MAPTVPLPPALETVGASPHFTSMGMAQNDSSAIATNLVRKATDLGNEYGHVLNPRLR
jgi:hypothetical protein